MYVEDRNAEAGRFNCGHRDGVWYVVIFQIQKDATATRNNLPNDVRTGGGEKLHADLEHADVFAQLLEQLERAGGGVRIESDNQFVFSLHLAYGQFLTAKGRRGFRRGAELSSDSSADASVSSAVNLS